MRTTARPARSRTSTSTGWPGWATRIPGLLDPFFAPDAIAFVEWPEHAPGAWPDERVAHRVHLAHARRRRAPHRGRVILGLDTATPSTAVGALGDRRHEVERRDDPPPGERPGHAARLLALVDEVVAATGRRSRGSRSGSARAASPACGSASPPPARSPRRATCRWSASRAWPRSPPARARRPGRRRHRRPPRRGVRRRRDPASSRSRSRPRRWPRGSSPARWPSATGRYAFGRSSNGPGRPSRRTTPRCTA